MQNTQEQERGATRQPFASLVRASLARIWKRGNAQQMQPIVTQMQPSALTPLAPAASMQFDFSLIARAARVAVKYASVKEIIVFGSRIDDPRVELFGLSICSESLRSLGSERI